MNKFFMDDYKVSHRNLSSGVKIQYSLPRGGNVILRLYNSLGKEVGRFVEGYKGAGKHVFYLDTRGLGRGVYFYKIQSGTYIASKKIIVTH